MVQWFAKGKGSLVGRSVALFLACLLLAANIQIYGTAYADSAMSFAGGTGTPGDPYLIATADQLNAVRDHLDKSFKLIADIDISKSTYASGSGWTPIGGSHGQFRGDFDGNGHVITRLMINTSPSLIIDASSSSHLGLFAAVQQGSIENITLTDVNIIAGNLYVGGLVGLLVSGTIHNSNVSGSSHIAGIDYVAGLAGLNEEGTISNSHASAVVYARDGDAGGLVGENTGTISQSYATGSVDSLSTDVGGLVGGNEGTINNSYATGSASGEGSIGGLAGYSAGTITNSYATGEVTLTEPYSTRGGGLVGDNIDGSVVSNSYYDSDTAGQPDNGIGTPLSGSDMKTQSNYTGWDFTEDGIWGIWGMDPSHNNGYPDFNTHITYDGNGKTSGDVPTDGSIHWSGDHITVAGNTGDLAKTGYTFAGWNTAADGSGTDYAGDGTATLLIGFANVTLYAQWEPLYTVTYDSNGATGSVPMDSGLYAEGVTVSVYGNTGNLVKTGYTFAGWNTAADGSGTDYAGDGTATLLIGSANVTLYAQWIFAAALSGLSVDQGTLAPAFAPSGLNYQVEVPNNVANVGISLVKGDTNQTLTVTGATYTSVTGDVYRYTASNLLVGANPVEVTVTAWDGTQNTYQITVDRQSNNADLSGLTLSSGSLTPEFAAGTTSYSAPVANAVSSLTVTASVYDSRATLTVNGAAVASGQASGAENLNIGANPITVVVRAEDGTTKSYTVTVTREESQSETSASSEDDASDPSTDFHIDANGKEDAQLTSGVITEENGRTVLTAKVDADKLAALLKQAGSHSVITIPVEAANTDEVDAVLTGDALKEMENAQVALYMQTPNGNYELPADQVSIDRLAAQLGKSVELSDIQIHVNIAKSDADKVKLVETAAGGGGFRIAVPPVDFAVTAEYQDKTVQIDTFSTYVRREIPLPDAVDPSTIATAVVLDANGTVHQVPTRLTLRDGKYYAVIDSLTNSTYTLISHPVTFADVTGQWYQAAVNDMASRMIVYGSDAEHYRPDASITRAEFAAIIVRAMGLPEEGPSAAFADVKAGDWYAGAVAKAQEHGLIDGYEDGTFRPDQPVSREDAMAIIARMMKLAGLDTPLSLADANAALAPFADGSTVDAWAKRAIATVVKNGIVSGSDAGLQPTSNITRAETAAIVERVLVQAKLIGSSQS